MEVMAVLNDSTGTLIAGSIIDPKCSVAVIVGTGSNACYLERVDRCPKWKAPKECDEDGQPERKIMKSKTKDTTLEEEIDLIAKNKAYYNGENLVAINTEWGALGDNGTLDFIRTEFDNELDNCSHHPHSFTYDSSNDYSC